MPRGHNRPPALPWWERVEALRQERGWTRVQLARKAGVARTTVDAWQTNPRAPLVTTVTSVARRLGIAQEEALQLAGLKPVPSAEAPTGDRGGEEKETPTDRLERLWREYRDDPGERGTVLRELLWTWGEERGEGQSEPEVGDQSETG